jgi:hypothetical protein
MPTIGTASVTFSVHNGYGGGIPAGNFISVQQYKAYKEWANTGIIQIISQGASSDARWMGIEDKIIVNAAPKANEIGQISGNTLQVRMGTYKTTDIIKNEQTTIGVHTYRIVMGTYSADWTPTYRNFCRISNQCSITDKRKFIMLYKYDEFKNKWSAVTADYADINSEFTTHNVDQQMRAAQ